MKNLLSRVEKMHSTDTTDEGMSLCCTSSSLEQVVDVATTELPSIRARSLREAPYTSVATAVAPLPQSTQPTPATPTNSPR